MERVRLANYADLAARVRTKLVRGLMFLHMKDGLDADIIRLKFSQDSYDLHRTPLSPLGVRKDFQKAVAELRTDLDAFTDNESKRADGLRLPHGSDRIRARPEAVRRVVCRSGPRTLAV